MNPEQFASMQAQQIQGYPQQMYPQTPQTPGYMQQYPTTPVYQPVPTPVQTAPSTYFPQQPGTPVQAASPLPLTQSGPLPATGKKPNPFKDSDVTDPMKFRTLAPTVKEISEGVKLHNFKAVYGESDDPKIRFKGITTNSGPKYKAPKPTPDGKMSRERFIITLILNPAELDYVRRVYIRLLRTSWTQLCAVIPSLKLIKLDQIEHDPYEIVANIGSIMRVPFFTDVDDSKNPIRGKPWRMTAEFWNKPDNHFHFKYPFPDPKVIDPKTGKPKLIPKAIPWEKFSGKSFSMDAVIRFGSIYSPPSTQYTSLKVYLSQAQVTSPPVEGKDLDMEDTMEELQNADIDFSSFNFGGDISDSLTALGTGVSGLNINPDGAFSVGSLPSAAPGVPSASPPGHATQLPTTQTSTTPAEISSQLGSFLASIQG